MDHNEISMFMDAKVDLHDKRQETYKFRQWIRCQVKIEAVKCLPCFLRITFETCESKSLHKKPSEDEKQGNLIISINVPGVAITLATSRTKQHSYALYWTQNRKTCFVYFALDTELSCRRHMKWIKKSIKNLELHRKVLLEERRCSRGVPSNSILSSDDFPVDSLDGSSVWSQRVSEIYEEIFDGSQQEQLEGNKLVHGLSRRCSRSSVASGIYEEMKLPFNTSYNFESINEEMYAIPSTPPPLPPLPSQRKRFNTYESEENTNSSPSVEIPRCNTNPETEMAKKKKYKNVLENLFHGSGKKRTVTTSESSKEEITEVLTTSPSPKPSDNFKSKENMTIHVTFNSPKNENEMPIYANGDAIADKRQRKGSEPDRLIDKRCSKRNSFSSPDLSKINFVDTFDENRIAELLNNSYSKCEELDIANCASLDETDFIFAKMSGDYPFAANSVNSKPVTTEGAGNLFDDYNISQKISNNFNFSASNSSIINLIAPLSSHANKPHQKNKIIFDDLSGYCVMAPIVKKMAAIDNTPLPKCIIVAHPLESVSSGYSTGSHSSSASSCTNSTEEPITSKPAETQPVIIQEESVIYETMERDTDTVDIQQFPNANTVMPLVSSHFTGNLYENLLTVKAAQELEKIPVTKCSNISTSTPTDSPLLEQVTPNSTATKISNEEEESFYQTPRKSIISIDEKIPSYYPNTCETSIKSRRRSYSPARLNKKNLAEQRTPISSNFEKSPRISSTTPVLGHLLTSKLRYERKENIYLTSPQALIEHRRKSKTESPVSQNSNISPKNFKSKKTAAHKISENVYAVKHCLKKPITGKKASNNNEENEPLEAKENKLQSELLQLAVLQNIDFKFEDTNVNDIKTATSTISQLITPASTQKLEIEEISCSNKKLRTNSISNSPTANTVMSKSTVTNETSDGHLTTGLKKFASLPRFRKFNLSPLRTRINNVLQRNHTPDL